MTTTLPLFTSVRRSGNSKILCGPGGLNCSCCRRGNKSTAKRDHTRSLRRTAKLAIRLNENV